MEFVMYPDEAQLPESADALFAQAEQGSMFFSRAWLMHLAHRHPRPLFACVLEADTVLALLPLQVDTDTACASLAHKYGARYSLLLTDTNQTSVLRCLAQGLADSAFTSLLLEPITENDHRMHALQTHLEACGFQCQRRFRFYNWLLTISGQPYSDYWAARPATLRNTVARKKRKLKREHGYDIRLWVGDAAAKGMADYYAAYTASWKANEQYTDFLNGMVAAFSQAGWTRLAVLYSEEKPIAAQLWFVGHRKAYIFRLAYDKAWKHYSPGSILTDYLMKYVIHTDQVETVDFLTGNEAYKQDWMSERQNCEVLQCIRQDTTPTWKKWLKKRLKK